MTKTRNKLKIIGLVLALVMMVSLLGLFSLTASAEAAADLTVTIDTGASVFLKDTDGDGYYDIGTADELYAFAAAVNGGNTAINGELTANIVVNKNVLNADGDLNGDGSHFRVWTPIGNVNNKYTGTFDGQNNTVGDLYFNDSDTRYVGLFGDVGSGGKVMNAGVISSVIKAKSHVGGVVGANRGTVENCYNTGSVSFNYEYGIYAGGVVGYNVGTVSNCYNTGEVASPHSGEVGGVVGSNYGGTVQNCYNTGAVSCDDYIVGGVVGSNNGTVQNCYNTGAVDGNVRVGGVLGENSSDGTVTNCYYLSECAKDGNSVTQFGIGNETAGSTTADVSGSTTGKNSLDFGNGSVCELVGYHSIDENCVCTNCGVVEHNNFDIKGFCTLCEAYQPAVDSNSDGYYEISNAGQLFWFANHVNTMDRTASAVLVADIDLENRPWTPIGETGEENNNFRGVFDGQNYTIRGLNVEGSENGVGFFGEVRTGTVKNFTIYGNVVVNTEVNYVGGVIGSICGVNGETDLERNGAIIQNITSYVNLTAKAHGIGMIGGFVGYANHQSLIEKCAWYGTFDAGEYRVDSGAGGFIGKIQEDTSEVTIRNCAAYGTIKTNYAGDYNNTATIYMGGFLSFSNTGAKTTLENCLFAGKFERGENLTDQAFLGAFGTLRSVNAIKNCYYLGDGVLEAVHSNSDLKPGSDNVEITSVTKAQLLSGEVAYKLGERFGQILEGENRQSYPVLGETKVEDFQRFEIYGQQLNIGADLSMKYYVMGYAPEFNSKGLYMEFSLGGVKTKVYADEPNADGFYVFVLEGINPQCMGDSIRAKLYYNETEVTSHGCEDGKEYSVEKNLLNLLEKYKDDAALVALINDTLAYGKAASEYKKHDTMTGDYTVSDSTIPDATVTLGGAFTGYTVVFGQVNFIKVSVELADGYTLYLDGTDITSQLVGGIFKTDGIAPTEFDQKFTFEIKNGDTVVQTFAVSVNDYIGAQKNSATMGNLVKALYNYGVSAEIYNHVKTGGGDHYYVDNVCACGKLETIDATAMTADELKAAVADQLAAGETDITVTLKPDASAEMVTAIRRAICDTEGVADGSINLTLKGVTTIPGTTNWDGVAFGPGDIYDEAGEIVDQELVTQLASINLPDVTEIGAQAFYFCENLLTVSAPKAQTIGAQALGYTALTSVEFPELTTIPTDMFSGTWTLSSAKFPKVTTIEQGGLLVGGKFNPENNPTPFPLELTAEGDITFNGSYHFNIAERNYTGKVDLVLNIDKKNQVTFHDDGTATWQVREDLSYTFKSITFVGE